MITMPLFQERGPRRLSALFVIPQYSTENKEEQSILQSSMGKKTIQSFHLVSRIFQV